MFEIDYNPCKRRYGEWISQYTPEQQDVLRKLEDDVKYIPKLIKLKRNRKPVEVNVGDVFLVSNKEGLYFYGKVIQRVNSAYPKYHWSPQSFVAFIFKSVTKEKKLDNYSPNFDDCACGPEIFDIGFWKLGYLEIIGNIPLTKEEKALDIGFYQSDCKTDGGIFVDSQGKTLSHFPNYYNGIGFITSVGISLSLSETYITDASLFE